MLNFIVGDSEMAQRIRSHAWDQTPLGPPEAWPESLKTMVSIMLAANQQMYTVWGPGRVLLYNDRYIEVLQGHHPDALGRNFIDVWSEIADDLTPLVENAYKGIPTYMDDIVLVLQRKGYAEETHFAYSYTPIFNASGGVDGFFCACIETTEQFNAREALRQSEEKYRALFDGMAEGYLVADVIFDAAGRAIDIEYVASNAAAIRMVGTDLTGKRLRAVSTDYEDYWYEIWGRVAVTGKSEHDLRFAAPEALWYDFNVFKLEPENSESRRVAVLFQDATDRKRAEAALSESEARFRAIAEQTEAGVAVADREGRLIWANDRLAEIVARQPDDTMWLAIQDYTHPDDWEENERLFRRMIEDGVPFVLEKRLGQPDGATRWSRVSVSPRRDAGGRVVGGIAVAIDISDRKQAEETLRESEERQAFLLKLSDALRTEPTADGIGTLATRMLADHLALDRCYIGSWQSAEGHMDVIHQVNRSGGPDIPSPIRPSDFPGSFQVALGSSQVIDDTATVRDLSDEEKQAMLAVGLRSFVGASLRKGEQGLTFSIMAISSEPRQWSRGEVALVEDAAERVWSAMESARAEAALIESEEKYRTLFETMGQGYAELEIIRGPDGRAVDIRYIELNPQFERLMGIPVAAALGRTVLEMVPEIDRWLIQEYDRILRSGQPGQVEAGDAGSGRWFDSKIYPRAGERLSVLTEEITERKKAEAALRESEKRQAFLLKLNDALRPLADPEAIQYEAMRLLGERLGASRAQYYTADETGEYLSSSGGYTDGVPAAIGNFRLIEFGKYAYDGFHAGETQVVSDARTDPRISPDVLKSYETVGFLAYIGVPFVQRGRFLGTIAVHQAGPREWTEAERRLIEETAERAGAAVESARADLARRASEERLQQFGEASQDVLWIRDAETLRWTYLTPAFEAIYGVRREDALGSQDFVTWLDLILPEDRQNAHEQIKRVAAGEKVAFEYRVRRPVDGEIRWLRNTDFPIIDDSGQVKLIGGIGHDITPLKQAEEHQRMLTAELQHRVRNTLAVIRSIARRTGGSSETVDEFAMNLEGRIDAFARVQAVVTRDPAAGIDLSMLVAEELRAASAREGETLTIDGPPLELKAKPAETIALGIHELATNAIKHGALQYDVARIDVSWDHHHDKVHFRWKETGVPLIGAPRREGLGTEILTRTLPYELGATARLELQPDGLLYELVMPDRVLAGPPATENSRAR